MPYADILIGGGGVIGLSTALELRLRGFKVKLIERGRMMAEASHAAAGMLAAEDPENPPELAPAARLSRELYPEYLKKIEALSGLPVPIRTRSTLQATEPGGRFACAQTATRFPIGREHAERLVPGVLTNDRDFLWLREASLDPRDLCAALPRAAAAAGVLLEEGTEILRLEASIGSAEVRTSKGTESAGAFVNCCGAWAGTIEESLAASADSTSPASTFPGPRPVGGSRPALERIEPRKGQMIALGLKGVQLEHVLRTPQIYLVPRGDGRVVIGATVERVGFDRGIENSATQGLLDRAAAIWPPAQCGAVLDCWTGLRPGTADDLPLIGRSRELNCWLATGHFRNGILLAPVTALLIRQMLEGGLPEIAMEVFAPDRLSGLFRREPGSPASDQ